MTFPHIRPVLSSVRFTVRYRFTAAAEARANAIAHRICPERTAETAGDMLADDDIRQYVVGRIED